MLSDSAARVNGSLRAGFCLLSLHLRHTELKVIQHRGVKLSLSVASWQEEFFFLPPPSPPHRLIWESSSPTQPPTHCFPTSVPPISSNRAQPWSMKSAAAITLPTLPVNRGLCEWMHQVEVRRQWFPFLINPFNWSTCTKYYRFIGICS